MLTAQLAQEHQYVATSTLTLLKMCLLHLIIAASSILLALHNCLCSAIFTIQYLSISLPPSSVPPLPFILSLLLPSLRPSPPSASPLGFPVSGVRVATCLSLPVVDPPPSSSTPGHRSPILDLPILPFSQCNLTI